MSRAIIPMREEQPSAAELREQFRADHLSDLRSQMASHHQFGWGVIGDPALSRARYTVEEWAFQMHHRMLDDPAFEFNVPAHLGAQLEDLAQKAAAHDSVTWDDSVEGTIDSDAPPCDLCNMTDEQLCDYVDDAVKRSRRDGQV